MLFEKDSAVVGVGSFSIITSIMSFKWIGVNFSVGALAYLNTNFVRSNTQNLDWNYLDIKNEDFWVSFFRYPYVTLFPK